MRRTGLPAAFSRATARCPMSRRKKPSRHSMRAAARYTRFCASVTLAACGGRRCGWRGVSCAQDGDPNGHGGESQAPIIKPQNSSILSRFRPVQAILATGDWSDPPSHFSAAQKIHRRRGRTACVRVCLPECECVHVCLCD